MTWRTVGGATLSAWAMVRLPWPCSCNLKIAVRVASSSIAGLPVKTAEQTLHVRLAARHGLLDLRAFDFEQLLQQALLERAARAPRNAPECPEIVEPTLRRRGRGRLLRGLRLQIDLRAGQDQLARARGAALPARIQRADLPTRRLQGRNRCRQLGRRRRVGARQRHQI